MDGPDRGARLAPPTAAVRESFPAGEWADLAALGGPGKDWPEGAAEDFEAFVAARRGVHRRWCVPCTTYWYVAGEDYIGTLIVRHRLTPSWPRPAGMSATTSCPTGGGRVTRMLAAGPAVPAGTMPAPRKS